ncbi:MAG: hypothetical protein EBT98_13205 [Opitutaceae bacterium]|nr:hypothetical protein [Opitutaceae bacterium]
MAFMEEAPVIKAAIHPSKVMQVEHLLMAVVIIKVAVAVGRVRFPQLAQAAQEQARQFRVHRLHTVAVAVVVVV